MGHDFKIDEDIRKAETLPATFYRSPEAFESLKEKVFYGSCNGSDTKTFWKPTKTPIPLYCSINF